MSDDGTVFKIETDDIDQHQMFLAGPTLCGGMYQLADALRGVVKYDSWPDDIAEQERTVDGLCYWVRGQISEIMLDAGVRE